MSATAIERLCALLDERGEDYETVNENIVAVYLPDRNISYYHHDGVFGVEVIYPAPRLNDTAWLTPEQAVAVTFGHETCEFETDDELLYECIPYAPEDTWGYHCTACGWQFRYDRGIKPDFCPNCGRQREAARRA